MLLLALSLVIRFLLLLHTNRHTDRKHTHTDELMKGGSEREYEIERNGA